MTYLAALEQILLNIAGNRSLVEQRFYTNDSNVFSKIDFADPAFFDAAFMLTVSNGRDSNFSPYPRLNALNNTNYYKTLKPHGFIYYSNQSGIDYETLITRKDRLTNILKETFHFDLIFYDEIVDMELGSYFPFAISSPNQAVWANYFNNTLSNLPADGYWSGFNQERLTNPYYLENHHLSSNLVFLKEYEFIEGLEAFLPYNLEEIIDIQSSNLGESLFDSLGGASDSLLGDFLAPGDVETDIESSSALDIFSSPTKFSSDWRATVLEKFNLAS